MNVLVILPTASAGVEAAQLWRKKLTDNDRLYVMSLEGGPVQRVSGIDVHPLNINDRGTVGWEQKG